MPKPLFRSLRVQVLLWTILPLLVVLLTFSFSGAGSHQVSMRQLVVEENTTLLEVASAAIQARLELHAASAGQGSSEGSAAAIPPLGLADLFPGGNERSSQSAPTIAVVDAHKRVLDSNLAPEPAALASPQSALDVLLGAALAGGRGVEFITQEGRQLVVAYAPLEGTPWAIVILRPIADLIGPFFRLEQVLPLILMAAALVSALTLHFGLSLVVRPVHALIGCAMRIGQGDFGAAAQSVGGVQEIEELRQALHAMAQLLQSEQAALQDYLRDVTNTQEEERARLAREVERLDREKPGAAQSDGDLRAALAAARAQTTEREQRLEGLLRRMKEQEIELGILKQAALGSSAGGPPPPMVAPRVAPIPPSAPRPPRAPAAAPPKAGPPPPPPPSAKPPPKPAPELEVFELEVGEGDDDDEMVLIEQGPPRKKE